jgi:uncharacterized SAM-binding protein YcdF (DUF218 family)
MFFWLKKTLSFGLMPLPLSMILIAMGLLILWKGRKNLLGRCLICVGFTWLLLCSNKAFSRLLLHPLECQFPAIPELLVSENIPPALASCSFVAVLGGGHGDDTSLPRLSQLSDSALARLTEGVRIARLLPKSCLIVSGAANSAGFPSHARVLKEAAMSLGFPENRILMIETARDSEDESVEIHKLVGRQPIALVSSAWHLPRVAALFRKIGITFIACPSDYKAKRPGTFSLSDYSWDTESLTRSTLAIREYIGTIWIRLRGKT